MIFAIPNNQFDPAKFKARYGLTDRDFKTGMVGSRLHVTVSVNLPDNPPIFDPPPAPVDSNGRVGPVKLRPGMAGQGTAAVRLEPGALLTHPEVGALEYVDDGVNGHLYCTINRNGTPTRLQIF